MIALDTNVVVRFLVRDNEDQAQKARRVIERCSIDDPGLLTHVVLCEIWWVLRRAYDVGRSDSIGHLRALTQVPELRVQDTPVIVRALRHADAGADFADAVIAETARSAGCSAVVSFDRAAQRTLGFLAPS